MSPTFKTLSRAAAKHASARLRAAGVLRSSADALRRTTVCARCPLYTVHQGKAYCGRPLLEYVDRSPLDGCGCPIGAKARDPGEHCPLTKGNRAATRGEDRACDCKWCAG